MAKTDLTCRFCSAPLNVIAGMTHAICDYCGRNQPIVDETQIKLTQETEPAPQPVQAINDDKTPPVVINNSNTQNNWGCLGAMIGIAILFIVIFLSFSLAKCSEDSTNNSVQNDSQQQKRASRRARPAPPRDYYRPRKVNSDGLPNVETIPD